MDEKSVKILNCSGDAKKTIEKIDNKWLKYNARAESKDSIGSCEDGLDNNYNGLTDKLDTACREF